MSGNGGTVVVGAAGDNHSRGAVWVFERDGSRWVQQQKLSPRGEVGAASFGWSVAVSEDGTSILVGALGDRGKVGAAWAFARRAGRWVQAGPKLTANDEVGKGEFGFSVALSATGRRALIGGAADDQTNSSYSNSGYGAVWSFSNNGSGWHQDGTKLVGRGETAEGLFGFSVALSADGDSAVVGAPSAHLGRGGVWFFQWRGGHWQQQGGQVWPSPHVGSYLNFGSSVALSAAGRVAIVGGPGDQDGVGAVWTYVRGRTGWAQEGNKLTPSTDSGRGAFGDAVELSPDGLTAVVGSPLDERNRGAAWVYRRHGAAWSPQQSKLTVPGRSGAGAYFGIAVAISDDASTALIGAGLTDDKRGAAWIVT